MTVYTRAINLCVIHGSGSNWRPFVRKFLMAGITRISRINVTNPLTAGNNTIVTGDAITTKTGMIHITHRGQPRRNQMTNITICTGEYVCCVFAGCNDAVMTGSTITRNPCVIKCCRQPGLSNMAHAANVTTCHMIKGFAPGNNTVMTTHAAGSANHTMIKCGGSNYGKSNGGMTSIASRRSWKMLV
jgi:hypothetical protein